MPWFEACCVNCQTPFESHSNVMLYRCSKCKVFLKIHKDASDRDIEDVREAIKKLVSGDYKVI